nr:MAG TPA: hypothetical protein [Caudoviricetes sp.]
MNTIHTYFPHRKPPAIQEAVTNKTTNKGEKI